VMLQIVVEVAGTVCDADCVSIACRDDQIKCEGNAALWSPIKDREAEYGDKRVCLCVCLSVRSSPILCMLAVARSSSGGVVIRYVLLVLCMTSCLLIRQGK